MYAYAFLVYIIHKAKLEDIERMSVLPLNNQIVNLARDVADADANNGALLLLKLRGLCSANCLLLYFINHALLSLKTKTKIILWNW